ncbi:MAG: O-methyltransferase [Chloroflexi bacterium]|nr:O-methyltransferase [Chloroflexota bacterium]
MFSDIPKPILDRMQAMEEQDARDRSDGTSDLKRLRQIPPETGMFLALLASSSPPGPLLEIGTSAGYSALWLSLASKLRGSRLVTYELLPEKAEMARETFKKAAVEDAIELVHGDARGHLSELEEIAFCFLDAEKEMYVEFYELLVPKLIPGGLLVADNFTSHAETLAPLLKQARKDKTVDAVVLPVGKGLLVCRKLEPDG